MGVLTTCVGAAPGTSVPGLAVTGRAMGAASVDRSAVAVGRASGLAMTVDGGR